MTKENSYLRSKTLIPICLGVLIFLLSLTYGYLTRFYFNGDEANYINSSAYLFSDIGPNPALDNLSNRPVKTQVGYPLGTATLLRVIQGLLSITALQAFLIINALTATLFFVLLKLFYEKFTGKSNDLLLFALSIPGSVILNHGYISDNLALVFFMAATYVAINTQWHQNQKVIYLFFISLLCFIPAFVRYSYYVTSYSIPLGIAVFNYYDRQISKITIKNLMWVFGGLSCLILLNVLFVKLMNNTLYYLNNNYAYTKSGLYWENLKSFTPFVLETFFDATKVIRSISIVPLKTIIFVGSHLASFLMIWFLFRQLKNYLPLSNDSVKKFVGINAFFLVLNIMLLIALSLKEAPQDHGTHLWTYVTEPRYYSVSLVFVLLMSLLVMANPRNRFSKIAVTLVLVASISFSFLMLAREFNSVQKSTFMIDRENKYEFLKSFQPTQPKTNVLYIDEDGSFARVAGSLGYATLTFQKFNEVIDNHGTQKMTPVVVLIYLKTGQGLKEYALDNKDPVLQLKDGAIYQLSNQ